MMCTLDKRIHILLTLIITLSLVFSMSGFVSAQGVDDVEKRKAELEAELAELEKEIKEKEGELNGQRVKSSSLQRDVNLLKTKIGKTQLEIRSQNITIEKLDGEITDKNTKIKELSEKIDREKESLGQLIRKTNEIDNATLIHLILGQKSLSNFYVDIDSFASIKRSIQGSVVQIRGTQKQTANEKDDLTKKQNAEIDAKVELERAKRAVERDKKEQNKLLNISKNKEAGYKKILAERKKAAAEIRSELFSLRDTAAIPFGEALDYATAASKVTGVRPAFILAVLKQESNLGGNVGSCYLRNTTTGAGVGKNTGRAFSNVMKPTRDVQPFLDITEKLGLDPFNTPVSCPWTIGYGGAMGPSQFIASTWKIFASRIANSVGVSLASPWNPEHAIMATAIYMDDLGADAQTFTAERDAACRYYSGRSCSDPKVKNLFYGNSVMNHAKVIQETMIDPLLGL